MFICKTDATTDDTAAAEILMAAELLTVDDALAVLDSLSSTPPLTTLQAQLIRGTWDGLTYSDIAQKTGYDTDYLKFVGSKLWRALSKRLDQPVSKSNLRAVLERLNRQQNQAQGLPIVNPNPLARCDWGDGMVSATFYGRQVALAEVTQWCLREACRLIVLQGQGGIGKTALARQVAQQVAELSASLGNTGFDRILWRSLRAAPPLSVLLRDLLSAFDLPMIEGMANAAAQSERDLWMLLFTQLQRQRCLIVLDNGESLLQSGSLLGSYHAGYEGYGEWFEHLSDRPHQSCVLLTSRELPAHFISLQERSTGVRTYRVAPLESAACQQILADADVSCEPEACDRLRDRYGGNPLALKIVATTIRDLFDGQVHPFLNSGTPLLQGIRQVLAQQFNRLMPLEQQVMDWLAIHREPITITDLQASFVHRPDLPRLIEALESLWRRSLIEKAETATGTARFTQQAVIMEYVTRHLCDRVVAEFQHSSLAGTANHYPLIQPLLNRYSLLTTAAQDYICNAQRRLILQPILTHLLNQLGSSTAVEHCLRTALQNCQNCADNTPGYAAGNSLNLLCELGLPLTQLDCTGLTFRQIDLRGHSLQQSSFAGANFQNAFFTETFGSILNVAVDPTGQWLASSDTCGDIRLWNVDTGQLQQTLTGHSSWVRTLVFHPTRPWLISGSNDHTIKVWDLAAGICRQTLVKHHHWVRSVAIAPVSPIASPLLASCDADGVICLWDLDTGECRRHFIAHGQAVRSLAFHPDGHQLLSGSEDGTLKLWRLKTGDCHQTFVGHTAAVYSVVHRGDQVISGSADGTIRLWDAHSGICLKTFNAHQDAVWGLSLNQDSDVFASSSADGTLRIWSLVTHECLRVLLGHHHWVLSVAFRPIPNTNTGTNVANHRLHLASGGYDQTVRLWDITTGRCLRVLQGYTNSIFALAIAPNGTQFASGSQTGQIHFWESLTGKGLRSIQAHPAQIWALAFSPEGQWIASAGTEPTISLWHSNTGECRYRLDAETYWVRSLAFSPDGQWLASAGTEPQLRLWDVNTGKLMRCLKGHRDFVWAVRFSPDGRWLASSSDDATIKLWDWRQGQCLKTLEGHTGPVEKIEFNPDGQWLASVAGDGTLCIWALPSGRCLHRLTGHTNQVGQLAVSADGYWLASGSLDQTVRIWEASSGRCVHILSHPSRLDTPIAFCPDPNHHHLVTGDAGGQLRLWDARTGACLNTWMIPRPYENLDITGATGLTPAQRSSLHQLGAIEHQG